MYDAGGIYGKIEVDDILGCLHCLAKNEAGELPLRKTGGPNRKWSAAHTYFVFISLGLIESYWHPGRNTSMQQVVAWYISTCTVWTKGLSSLDITCYFDSSAAESGSINQMLARMPLICLAIDGIHIAEIPKTSNWLCLDPDPEGRVYFLRHSNSTAI